MDKKELREYCIDNHREMWHWLAENPTNVKKDWPGWDLHNNDVFDRERSRYCFLCGYVSAYPNKSCSDCLLDWGISEFCELTGLDGDTYFERYCLSGSSKDRTKYAEIIANLPMRKT